LPLGRALCFPELGSEQPAALIDRFGEQTDAPQRLRPVDHGFMHFRLRIHPLIARVRLQRSGAEEPGRLWLNLEEAKGAPIPTPVRRILEALSS